MNALVIVVFGLSLVGFFWFLRKTKCPNCNKTIENYKTPQGAWYCPSCDSFYEIK